MFSEIRIREIVHTTILWGATAITLVTVPLIVLRQFGALDSIGTAYLIPQHPRTSAGIICLIAQMVAFFPGAVMGFWVGLTREKVRARACDQPGSDNYLRS